MFFLETRNSEGNLNNIEVVRLKDKLGTRQVPTAELLLDGTNAVKVRASDPLLSNIGFIYIDQLIYSVRRFI